MGAFELATRLPFRCYLKVGRESDPETGEDFLTAVIMEDPPEAGWRDRPERHRFDERCRTGVSASSVARLEALAVPMLEHFIASRLDT